MLPVGIAKRDGMGNISRFEKEFRTNRGEIVDGIAVTFSFVVD